jgi:integrase
MKLLKYTKTKDGWKVDIPASLTGDKRRREFYPTRERAEARVNQLNDEIKDYGSGGVQIPPHHYHDCANAIELLEGYDITLSQIAQDWINRNDAIKQSVTLVELAEAYVDDEDIELGAFVARSYIKTCKRVSETFSDLPTHDLTSEHFKNGLNQFPVKSRKTIRAQVNAILNWGAERSQGFHVENVLNDLKKRKKTKQTETERPQILSHKEAQALLNTIRADLDGKYLPYYVLSLFAGLRRSEVGRITWDDIDLQRGHVFISSVASKTKNSRYVKLMPNAIEWLKICNQSEDIRVVPTKRQNTLRRKAGIKWQRNIMRHTACSMFYAYHEDEKALTSWAGHSLDVFFKHYQNAVLKQDAIKFWSSTPQGETVELLRQIV